MPAVASTANRFVYDAKGQRVVRLALSKSEAQAGGTFYLDEGSSGCFYDRPTSAADTSVTLPPNAPHLSLWRLANGQLARLCYREYQKDWVFDEDRKVLTVMIWPWDQLRTKSSSRFRTPWPGVELTSEVRENDSIVATFGLGPPGRLAFRSQK